jgi:DNA mismatch repair protein MutS2
MYCLSDGNHPTGKLVLYSSSVESGLEELRAILDRLAVEHEPLPPVGLLGLARFVGSVTALVDRVRRAAPPLLCDLLDPVLPFDDEVAAVRRAIQPSGDVADDASPALREIRDGLRRHRAKLRTTLEALTRGRDTAKYLQEQLITDRNGRYVIVVRSEHRDAIPGIVHDASASGASLYVEPLATVSLNNDVVALSAREHVEVQRILLAPWNAPNLSRTRHTCLTS